MEDIAPFAVLPKNAWDVKGIDFSLPYDEKKTGTARTDLEKFLADLDKRSGVTDLRKIRIIAYHNLEMAKKMLNGL